MPFLSSGHFPSATSSVAVGINPLLLVAPVGLSWSRMTTSVIILDQRCSLQLAADTLRKSVLLFGHPSFRM